MTTMKMIYISVAACLLTFNASAQLHLIYSSYQRKDFSQMQQALKRSKSRPTKSIFSAAAMAAYGDYAGANKLLQQQGSSIDELNDTLQFVALNTKIAIAAHYHDYRAASASASKRLARYGTWIPKEDLEEEGELAKIYQIARGVSPQYLTKLADTEIPLQKDRAGLLNVPVTVGDSTLNFVFDSGAGMSVISGSYATKLKLRVLSDSTVQVRSGSTGAATAARVAVAPSLRIGNMEVQNTLFLVFPDEALTFAAGRYVMKGIIGFPVLAGMEELTLSGQNLVVPVAPRRSGMPSNMIIENHMPIIYLRYQKTLLPFTFDSGATTSSLSDNFYKRFRADVEGGTPKTKEFQGVGGGTKSFAGLVLPQLTLRTGDTAIKLNDIFVMKERFDANGTTFYGNIGKDAIEQFKSITINFVEGRISFNN